MKNEAAGTDLYIHPVGPIAGNVLAPVLTDEDFRAVADDRVFMSIDSRIVAEVLEVKLAVEPPNQGFTFQWRIAKAIKVADKGDITLVISRTLDRLVCPSVTSRL